MALDFHQSEGAAQEATKDKVDVVEVVVEWSSVGSCTKCEEDIGAALVNLVNVLWGVKTEFVSVLLLLEWGG